MKKLALLLVLALILGIFPASGASGSEEAATPAEAEGAAVGQADQAEAPVPDDVPPPPTFTLITQENDGPKVARLKAALRMLKYYQATTNALQTCVALPEAANALNDLKRRNGNTVAHPVMRAIREEGGLTPEIKAVVDKEVADGTAALLEKTDCLALVELVSKKTWDIHNAAELAEDYKLVRAKK
jgi:hypothetical protein